jgi:hypothetical protein
LLDFGPKVRCDSDDDVGSERRDAFLMAALGVERGRVIIVDGLSR